MKYYHHLPSIIKIQNPGFLKVFLIPSLIHAKLFSFAPTILPYSSKCLYYLIRAPTHFQTWYYQMYLLNFLQKSLTENAADLVGPSGNTAKLGR